MTKRFTFSIDEVGVYWYVYDGSECVIEVDNRHDACKICNLLNKQDERIQELENENRMLRVKLDTHKHPLWSTREAERVVNELEEEDKQIKQKIKELKKEIERLKEDNKSLRLGFK